jgi:hypothetical protein
MASGESDELHGCVKAAGTLAGDAKVKRPARAHEPA